MAIRIGINGFGRIGRCVLRSTHTYCSNIEVVAVNDLVPPSELAYLLRYDSVHGHFGKEVQVKEKELVIEGKSVAVLAERDPAKIPWKELSVDYVIESTGLFTHLEDAKKHLTGGAKRVVISAPAKGGVPTFVMGVNHEVYNPKTDTVVSNASCTTNCLAPITKVLLDHFGIEEGLMTTIHAMTATQPVLDSPSKVLRGGRSACMNIIPASTGAAKAVALCLPEIAGKLTGMAFRVPVADVSVVDFTVRLTKSTSYAIIADMMKFEASSSLKGVLGYTEEGVVSSDFIGDTRSSIFDYGAGIELNDRFYKLLAWYDNETGYSCRVLDLIEYMESRE